MPTIDCAINPSVLDKKARGFSFAPIIIALFFFASSVLIHRAPRKNPSTNPPQKSD